MKDTPILFVIFNRPHTTEQVMKAIQQEAPRKLYIAADGPRNDRPADAALCRQTRELVQNMITWDCDVYTLFRDENKGCGHAVSEAITWFFDHNEYGIILEDDCLPHPDFFIFCNEMLSRYKDDERIMHIGGTNFQDENKRGDGSYYFSSMIHVWGWASWKRAWKHYDFNLSSLDAFLKDKKIEQYTNDQKIIQYWENIFRKMRNHEIDTWDYQWVYSNWNQGGLAIIPNSNLISNIGFGADATHTVAEETVAMKTEAIGAIIHPGKIMQDKTADSYTFYHHYQPAQPVVSPAKRVWHLIKRLTK